MRLHDVNRAGSACALMLMPLLAAAWPAVPMPEGSQGEMVSGHMNVNGIDMRAAQFMAPLAFEEALAFYRQLWDEHVENEYEGNVIIGRAEGEDYYITVTMAPAGPYTEGTIGIVRVPPENARPFEPGAGFERPAGTDVTSDITHHDLPGKVRNLVLENELSPFANRQYFLERLHAQGWRLADNPDCLAGSWACMFRMEQARGARLTMTMHRTADARTQITVLIEP